MDYFLAQLLSLVFYIITLAIYQRAQKEYRGGKIAAAINLIMVFLVILLLSDFTDYFLPLIVPIAPDTRLIITIILKLTAMCVLFFGGLRFFVSKPAQGGAAAQDAALARDPFAEPPPAPAEADPVKGGTVVIAEPTPNRPTLGRYEIVEQIGRGAAGIVYEARDPKLNRPTAIKTIRFSDDFDEDQIEEARKQFYHEAKVIAKLSHPNIVAIYDVGEDLDLTYLAMEYLEGESLENYTRAEHLLPMDRCLDVIRQVCDALDYLHRHDIVHRDIKPSNIMLLNNGQAKVADFGIARPAAGTRTGTGIIKGTPYYMSPEQIKGIRVTGLSDIFSLGVVFYQLLTGRLPFAGENLSAVMYQITQAAPTPPTDHNPRINRATLTILDRALQKDPKNRYQTAGQMAEHLNLLGQKMAQLRSRHRG